MNIQGIKNDGSNERPLDQTTARIVTELAAALLPQLKETLDAKLAQAAEVFSPLASRDLMETLTVLKQLQENSDAISATLLSAERAMQKTSLASSPQLESLYQTINTAAAQINANTESIGETARLLGLLETAVPDWEGVLKANARAQTRELSELAAEMSELLKDTKLSLLRTVKETTQETMEKEISLREGRIRQEIRENEKIAAERLARLEKLVILWGTFTTILLAILCILRYFLH